MKRFMQELGRQVFIISSFLLLVFTAMLIAGVDIETTGKAMAVVGFSVGSFLEGRQRGYF